MKLVMPGACYGNTCECSSVPDEEHWPEPTQRRAGRGYQYVYDVDAAQARDILSHVLQLFEGWFGYEEAADDRATTRPFLRRYGVLDGDGYVTPESAWLVDEATT